MGQCDTQLLAFNLNSLQDGRNTGLPSLLLSQYYMFRGYSGNRIYARVIKDNSTARVNFLHCTRL